MPQCSTSWILVELKPVVVRTTRTFTEWIIIEPRHEKTCVWHMRTTKAQTTCTFTDWVISFLYYVTLFMPVSCFIPLCLQYLSDYSEISFTLPAASRDRAR